MKKLLSMIFIGLIMFSTLTVATDPQFIEEYIEPVQDYFVGHNQCGPNDINCNQVELDVVFVVDSTGSMHDEIRTVKEELTNIIGRINSGNQRVDVKVGVVTYKDYQDREYLTQTKQLTRNTWSVVSFIRNLEARGGGDYEEAVGAGLNEAIHNMHWRNNAEKMIILVGDAPARNNIEYESNNYGNNPEFSQSRSNWKNAVSEAQDMNIRIYTASGSGMNEEGISQWRTIAEKTGGSYIRLIYERRAIEEYYDERDIPMEFIFEARDSSDYESLTDSIMTNNFGDFATKSLSAVAKEANFEKFTGNTIREQNSLTNFFKEFISKLKFWN